MKRKLFAALGVVFLLALIGVNIYAAQNKETPMDVVNKYYNAIKEGKYAEAVGYRYFPEESRDILIDLNMETLQYGGLVFNDFSVGGEKQINDNVFSYEVSIVGYKDPHFPENENTEDLTLTNYAANIGGEWKLLVNPSEIPQEISENIVIPPAEPNDLGMQDFTATSGNLIVN